MNDLRVIISKNLGFIPELLGYLANIKDSECSSKYYNLKHPGGIFGLTTDYVLNDFNVLLKDLEEYQTDFEGPEKANIEDKFKQLIYNFFKFVESCFEIIQSCCKQHQPPSLGEFLWKWLKKNGYMAGEILRAQTKDDLEYFRKIYNKLKHTNQELRSICFHKGKSSIMGYYIESVASNGGVGPDLDIHPKFNGGDSASSYNFNLRKLYYFIYKITNVLQDALMNHFKVIYGHELDFDANYKSDDKLWKEIYSRMEKLPDLYFPNEFGQELPLISRNQTELVFKIKSARVYDLRGYKITYEAMGDGFSKKFRLPFFSPKKPPNKAALRMNIKKNK